MQRHKDWYGHGFRGLVSFCTAYYFGALKTLPLILLQTSYWSVLLRMARGAEGWQPPTARSWIPQKCFSTEQVYPDTYWLPLCAMFFHSVVQFGLVKVKNLKSILIIQHNGPWMLFSLCSRDHPECGQLVLEWVLEKDRFYVSGSIGSHVIKRERPTICFMTGNTIFRNLWKKDDTVLLTLTVFCANTPLTYVPNIPSLHSDIM